MKRQLRGQTPGTHLLSPGTRRASLSSTTTATPSRWLIVRLLGTTSSRDAVGARVRASASLWASPAQQMRQIGGGALGDPRAHFGLGDATNVTTLRIEWSSGIVQELSNVAANAYWRPRTHPLTRASYFMVHGPRPPSRWPDY